MKVRISEIQVGKTSLKSEAKLIIERFFGTHTEPQKSLQLCSRVNDRAWYFY